MPKNDYQRFMDYIRGQQSHLLLKKDGDNMNARQVFDEYGKLWRGIEGQKWRQENGVKEPK